MRNHELAATALQLLTNNAEQLTALFKTINSRKREAIDMSYFKNGFHDVER